MPDGGASGIGALAPSDRRRLGFFVAVNASLLLASVIYAPWASTGPVLCPFRFATGLPCPGCGLTRSFCAMAHGHVWLALSYHLFGPALFVVAAGSIPVMLYQLATNRPVHWFDRILYSRRFGLVLALTFGGYHVARLVSLFATGRAFTAMAHAPMTGWMWH